MSDTPTKADANVTDEIPSPDVLTEVDKVTLFDKNGKQHTFRSIYDLPGVTRHVVIFNRHLTCGICQEYIKELDWHIPPSHLPPGTAISVISNGTHENLATYIEHTSCPYSVFTDPSLKSYKLLNLAETLSLGPTPGKYIKRSLLSATWTGIIFGLKTGKNALKNGNYSQVGGEFLFERQSESDPWKLQWVHRMRSTRDHAEVSIIMEKLGITESANKGERS